MNILFLYDARQTYTNAVYDHLAAFAKFSKYSVFYVNSGKDADVFFDMSNFDAVCVHYSLRLPFDELSHEVVRLLKDFSGVKFLFIQDEYNNTNRACYWINELEFQLVFTAVPERAIERIYPRENFPRTRFVSNLTGYVSHNLNCHTSFVWPSQRSVLIGYRGRNLPLIYGALGIEKSKVGQIVRDYCELHSISSDIDWEDGSRIYGSAWNVFMSSCRGMLGSESGSNVFDWDGQLQTAIETFKVNNPQASDHEVYHNVVRPREIDGLMNQVSPRIFEAIAARTVLVLFEGEYSGVIKADEHFIPIKKDGSNLDEVFEKLSNNQYVDQMAQRAYSDVIESGRYSYQTFVSMVDSEIGKLFNGPTIRNEPRPTRNPMWITTSPIRHVIMSPSLLPDIHWEKGALKINFIPLWLKWQQAPWLIRYIVRPVFKGVMRIIKFRG